MKKVGGTAAIIVLFILLSGTQLLSQGRKMNGTIKGIVHESNSDQPVVYANVSLRNVKDSSVVTGDMTDDAQAAEVIRQYNFFGIYPNAVSAIPLDYGATDQIEEFQVTFNYIFWNVINEQP